MFRKQDKELQRLQEQLLEEEEDVWEDETGEFDDGEAMPEECTDEDTQPFCRNYANGYGDGVRNYANRYGRGSRKTFDEVWDDDDPEEAEVLYRDDFRREKRRKSRKNLLLWIIAVLELVAICAIVLWWSTWML